MLSAKYEKKKQRRPILTCIVAAPKGLFSFFSASGFERFYKHFKGDQLYLWQSKNMYTSVNLEGTKAAYISGKDR